ncbi:MAG: 4-phosphoerythronate dehydrogenase, partial [Planctomycetota bacterium]|nr:4-phosphoerythronate dehydrogenase [Planctomycetota bacterium]
MRDKNRRAMELMLGNSMKIVADGNIPFVKECFSSLGEVKVVGGREITPTLIADTDILLVRSITPTGQDLLAGSRVRFVGTATIGFDHIDVDYLRKRNIGFASAPGSNANSVAEYVVAALLQVGQKYGITLEGKSIGILGVGNVGSRVAQKAAALGMKVYLNDPPLARKKFNRRERGDRREENINKEYLPIEKLFDCDFITLHTPLTFDGGDKTFHLADEKFFKSLKNGFVFLNTSRGGVADTSALKKVIREGKLQAAVLDVWENEPDIDPELLQMVDIATPHIAGYSFDGKVGGMFMIYKAACKHFGLKTKFNAESFLPLPIVPQLKINPQAGNEQKVLL